MPAWPPTLEQQNPAGRKAFAILRELLPLLRDELPREAGATLERWLPDLRQHRLTPFLYWTAARQGWDRQLPPLLQETLRHDYAVALQVAFHEENEIKEVLRALGQAALDPVLLKGADLRRRLYREAALRPMVDVDFLIAPGDLARMQAAVEGLGYRLSPSLEHPPARFIEQFGFELLYYPPPGKRLLLEPHWGICAATCQYALPYEPLYSRAIPWDYDGIPVKLLSPEHLLLHLCIHAHSDIDNAMQLVDIMLVLERLPLDWPHFLQEVARFRCARPVAQLLEAMDYLSPQAVPPGVLASLKAYRPGWDERMLMGLRGGLRRLSPYFPGLNKHRRLWEMATFLLAKFRSRFRSR